MTRTCAQWPRASHVSQRRAWGFSSDHFSYFILIFHLVRLEIQGKYDDTKTDKMKPFVDSSKLLPSLPRDLPLSLFDPRNSPPRDRRQHVSQTTCYVPFPPRRTGGYRTGMISARPLYRKGPGDRFGIPKPLRSGPVIGRTGDCLGPLVPAKACHKANS